MFLGFLRLSWVALALALALARIGVVPLDSSDALLSRLTIYLLKLFWGGWRGSYQQPLANLGGLGTCFPRWRGPCSQGPACQPQLQSSPGPPSCFPPPRLGIR